MKKMILALTILALTATTVTTATAATEDLTITTGSKTGTYIKAGYSLASILGIPRDGVVTSKGSVENLDRINAGDAQIGFSQADSYAMYIDKNPDFAYKGEVAGVMYEECTYGAVLAKGKFNSEDDLKSKEANVAIGKKGSGSVDTWKYFGQLDKGFAKATPKFLSAKRALGKLAAQAGPEGEKLSAVFWTERPSVNSVMVGKVLSNPKLKLIGFNSRKLNNKHKVTGKPVYHFSKPKLKKGFGGKYKTACMDALIVIDAEMDEDDLDNVSSTVFDYGHKLVK